MKLFSRFLSHLSDLVFLSLLVLALVSCHDEEQRKQQLLLKGNEALDHQDFEQAVFYYEQAARLDSCFGSAYNNIGTAYLRSGRPELALEWYRRAVDCSPESEFLLNRANAYFDSRAYDSALSDIDKVLRHSPDSVPALALKGVVLSALHRYHEAESIFDRSLTTNPDHADHWVNRAVLRFQTKRLPEARQDLEQALSIDSLHADALNTMAMVEAEAGNAQNGLKWVVKALAKSPNHPFYLNNRGWIRVLLNRLDEAEQDIQSSLAIAPENPWAMRNRGLILLMRSDADGAAQWFVKALALDPETDRVRHLMGMALHRQGKTAEGCRMLLDFTADPVLGFRNPCR